jgi:hypothetical protein
MFVSCGIDQQRSRTILYERTLPCSRQREGDLAERLYNQYALVRPHTGMRQDMQKSRHDVCDMTQRKEHSWNEWDYENRRTPVW